MTFLACMMADLHFRGRTPSAPLQENKEISGNSALCTSLRLLKLILIRNMMKKSLQEAQRGMKSGGLLFQSQKDEHPLSCVIGNLVKNLQVKSSDPGKVCIRFAVASTSQHRKVRGILPFVGPPF